jgi:Cytochrome c554 and c-prime
LRILYQKCAPLFLALTAALTTAALPAALAQSDPHTQPSPSQPGSATPAASKFNPQTCASCHPSQARTQPYTSIAHALQLPSTNPILKAHPLLTFHRGAYNYKVETVGENSTYSVTDGTQTITLPIRWGLGVHGQTWVLEQNGKLHESLVSYYPTISGLDITTGHEDINPATLEEAVGPEMIKNQSKACFGCHATNVLLNGNLSLETLQPGITCQHCHQGAMLHATDANAGNFDTAPPKLGRLSSESISNFCGQCHRTWETVVRSHWAGSVNARFPAYRLANSRCFDGADPRISCIACHDPHQNLVHEASNYDSKCLACHAPPIGVAAEPATAAAASATREQAKVCPVAKSGCTTCHMPKIPSPNGGGHYIFTDHQIRVVKPGEPYPD